MELQDIELTIEKEKDGVFAISFVENPAIQEDFIALNSHLIELKVSNEDKREVVGLALVPEKRIYRRVKDKEFNIWFSAETIKQTNEKFMQSLNLNNVTVDHKEKVQDVSVIESWIVEDEKQDKSNLYNLNAVVGSWVVKMKVNNDEVWQDVKSGKYKGFSIEALYSGMDKVLASKEETTVEQIKEVLTRFFNA
jgi:hypothetical protein